MSKTYELIHSKSVCFQMIFLTFLSKSCIIFVGQKIQAKPKLQISSPGQIEVNVQNAVKVEVDEGSLKRKREIDDYSAE